MCLALGHLVSLDCRVVGAEWLKDDNRLIVYTSERNSLDVVLHKAPADLTRADALLCAAAETVSSAAWNVIGMGPMAASLQKTLWNTFLP